MLKYAHELGLVKIGNISVDGSKFKANASKHSAMSYGHIVKLEKHLEKEIQQLLKLSQKVDIEEEQLELDIPKEMELRENRLSKISQAKLVIEERAKKRDEKNKIEYEKKLKRRQEKEKRTGKKIGGKNPSPPKTGPREKDQYNFTDPESAIMKSGSTGAFEQDYNAQAAVDQETYLIMGNELSNHPNDKKELTSTLDSIPEEIGKPDAVAADNGYFSESNIEECKKRNIEPFISTGREPHYHTIEQLLEKEFSNDDIKIEGLTPSEEMKLKLKSKEGKEIFRKRKFTVEPVFGIIKNVMGFRQFSLRGLENVKGEWDLVCGAYNLKRMFNMTYA